jgi:hypothetical protein
MSRFLYTLRKPVALNDDGHLRCPFCDNSYGFHGSKLDKCWCEHCTFTESEGFALRLVVEEHKGDTHLCWNFSVGSGGDWQ